MALALLLTLTLSMFASQPPAHVAAEAPVAALRAKVPPRSRDHARSLPLPQGLPHNVAPALVTRHTLAFLTQAREELNEPVEPPCTFCLKPGRRGQKGPLAGVPAVSLSYASRRKRRRQALQVRHRDNTARKNLTVLFLGNSFTFFNDVTSMVQNLSAANNETTPLATSSNAKGGYTMEDHANDSKTKELLSRPHNWTYVILQEQSQLPSLDQSYRDSASNPYISQLVARIRAVNAVPLLFLTWGYKMGDQDNNPGDSYAGMQSRLVTGYTDAAKKFRIRVVPVGLAWSDVLKKNGTADLYDDDDHHPSVKGSYLVACTFFSFLNNGLSPVGNPFVANNISAEEARELQTVAGAAVVKYKIP